MRFLINLTEKIKASYSFHRERKTLPVFFLSIPWLFIAIFSVLLDLVLFVSYTLSLASLMKGVLEIFLFFIFGLVIFGLPVWISYLLISLSVRLLKLSSKAFETSLLLIPISILPIPLLIYKLSLIGSLLGLPLFFISILTSIYLWHERKILIGEEILNIQQIYLVHKDRKTTPFLFLSPIFLFLGTIFLILYFWIAIWMTFFSPGFLQFERTKILASLALMFGAYGTFYIWGSLGLLFLKRYTLLFTILGNIFLCSLSGAYAFIVLKNNHIFYSISLLLICFGILIFSIYLLLNWKKFGHPSKNHST